MASDERSGTAGVLADPDARLNRVLDRSAGRFPRRLFLGFRLITRLFEALIALQADHGWPLALAALGCAILDLRMARVLNRPAHRLVPRAALDTLDVTLWSLALPGAGDVAVIVATPLVIEAGLRYGVRGLVLPVVVGGASTAAVAFTGGFTVLNFLWPLFGGIGGMLAGGYLRARWRGEERVVRYQIEAAVSQAELAGQNSVAMGADSVVDLLVRTAPLIAAYEPAPVPGPFSGWKAALAEACGRQSTYLGVALIRWQRLYNSRSPDLSTDVELRISPGAGTLLLSPAQARHLEARLDEMGLRGTVTVDAERLAPPGQRQVVIVDGEELTMPADPRPHSWPVHAAPFAFAAGAVIALAQSVPQWEAVPLWATGPIAILLLVAAWWAHRHVDRDPGQVAGRVIAVALLIGAVEAVTTSALMRAGSGRLPFLFFLHWAGPVVFVYARDLRRSRLPLVIAGIAAAVGAGMAAMPYSFAIVDVAPATLWFFPALLAIMGLREIIERDATDVRERRGALYEAAVRDGFRRGRLLVVELTADAVDQLRNRYRALEATPPRDVGAEIERRLEEAGTMLRAATATTATD